MPFVDCADCARRPGTGSAPGGGRAGRDAPLPPGKVCLGSLRLSDKAYKLEQAVAYQARLYDNDVLVVLLSDKPIPLDKLKAALVEGKGSDDRFSLFQPHVKVTFDQDGKPLYCSCWAANTSLSISGSEDLKGQRTLKDGRVRGSTSLVRSDKPGSKDGFDARFDVALLAVALPKAPPKSAPPGKPQAAGDDGPAAKAGSAVKVGDLPIPKDATDVEYKQLVGHIGFKSKSDVKTLSAALTKSFKQQGWQTPDEDLVTAASAILKRTKGPAELTLFVKPDGAGSKVTIMSEGLTWGDEAADEDE